jgi:hypothetical protein
MRSIVAAVMLLSSVPAFAAKAKTYQVTGPVLAVEGDTITVQKGKEKWEIDRDAKTNGDTPKVGDKVTIEYRMTATRIENRGAAKSDAKSDKAAK